MKIAYLVNRYPTVSHTFVRREIAGIEAAGHPVRRYSVRAAPDDLPDPVDRAERERTLVVLGQSRAALLAAALGTALTRPARTWRAWRATATMTPRSWRGRVARIAYLVEAAWLARDMRAAGIGHCHAHFGTNPAAVARLVALIGDIPYSVTVHGPDEFDEPRQIDLAGKIADAKFVVAISDYGRSQLCRWVDPALWHRIVVVRCGVDLAAFAPRGDEAAAPGDVARFCCVARLAPQKGLPILVEAMKRLRGQGRAVHLVVIGDGPLRPQLEDEIARAGLDSQIELLGSRDGAAVAAQLRAADAMVLPSFAEGLPVVIMESLAVGTPVVTTFVAGIPELIDQDCGWLVPPASADRLAEAMIAATEAGAERRRAMGAEGRRRVADRHDADRNAQALLAHILA